MSILSIIFINLLILILSIYLFYKFRKHLSNNIYFNNTNESCKILKDSNYFNKFNKIDYKVRNCNTSNNCFDFYCKNIIEFTNIEKKYLIKLVKLINIILYSYPKLNVIKWKFSKFSVNIENGYPHTHLDTIFLSENFFKNSETNSNIETLIHEKLHIYQRIYKNETTKFYEKLNFIMQNCICSFNMYHRLNPDVDSRHYIYKGYLVRNQYSMSAKTIADVNIIFNRVRNNENNFDGEKELKELKNLYNINIEHPNEIFATLIPLFIINKINLDKYFSNFKKTLENYLDFRDL